MGLSKKAAKVKEAYEAGFLKAVELFKTDKELIIKTFNI